MQKIQEMIHLQSEQAFHKRTIQHANSSQNARNKYHESATCL